MSNLILTSEVGIYNEEKSIEMAKDGIIVTTNTMNKNVFTIRKEITDDEGNITYERQLYIDDNGNIRLAGNASIAWDSVTGTENVVVKDTLNEFMVTVKEQIDGKIDTFRQSDDPSVNWTDEEKKSHENDLWYDTTHNVVKMWNGSSWDDFTGDVPESVWNEINGKAQIFTDTPKTPYNKGDLWFVGENGIYIDAEHPNEYRNEILTCINPKADGTLFSINDWTKQNKYTDDTTANTIKNDILGSTYIDKQWVIAPNIKGGQLLISNKSGTISAHITSEGKLIAKEGEFSGKIVSTSGEIGGFNIDNYSLWSGQNVLGGSGVYISPKYGISCNSSFQVTTGGKLTATDADITGDITATSIYAKDNYNIYVDGKSKASKVIWCDTNEYEWNPNAGYADLYMGHDGKAWTQYIDLTTSNSKFVRRAILASQYVTASRQQNRSSVNCVTTQDTTYVEITTTMNDTPASIRLQIAADSGLCLIPGDVNDSTLAYDEAIKLGTRSHKWMQVWTKNLYANGDTVRFSGIPAKSSNRYLVIDSSGNVGYRDGSGGGSNYYAGNGLYLSGSTFNIGYNSRYSVDFYEGSNSNHYAFCPTLANNAGDTYRLYLGGNGGDTHPWYKVVTRDGMQQLSDGRFKIDKCILNDDFYDMYMSLKPTKYKVLHDEDSGIHFGFVAQEVEESLKTVGLDASNCSIVSCDESQSYEGGYVYGLSYNEFIPFNTYMTQKAHHRIDSLESQLTDALSVIESLKKEIETLKQAME